MYVACWSTRWRSLIKYFSPAAVQSFTQLEYKIGCVQRLSAELYSHTMVRRNGCWFHSSDIYGIVHCQRENLVYVLYQGSAAANDKPYLSGSFLELNFRVRKKWSLWKVIHNEL